MTESTFIGVDLAWSASKSSGWAVLTGDHNSAKLLEAPETLRCHNEVLARLRAHTAESTFVAIDAPLIVTNPDGQRRCETGIGKRYGARSASCHSSNLKTKHLDGVRNFTKELESLGFRHAVDTANTDNQHVMLEVYPHPALIELFDLRRIIGYKKGTVADKRAGQRELQRHLHNLRVLDPPVEATQSFSEFLEKPDELQGSHLKAHEDKLDAIVCAYCAYHYWRWCTSRNEIFGDLKSGYIVVPVPFRSVARRPALPVS